MTIQNMTRSVVGIKGVLVCLLALLPVVQCEIRDFNLLLEPVVRKNDTKGPQTSFKFFSHFQSFKAPNQFLTNSLASLLVRVHSFC